MEKGEKYLSIKIVGHEFIKAFPNKAKKAENHPDFKADGVAVWIMEKKGDDNVGATLIKPKDLK